MRVAFVADVHVANHKRYGGAIQAGLNDRCRAVIKTLQAAYRRARELNCEAFFVLGDLFDTDTPSPQIITAVKRAISGSPSMPTYLLLGNHEMYSMQSGDHALGPIDGYSLIEVIDTPRVLKIQGVEFACIPFQPGVATDWLPAELSKLLPECRDFPVLLSHVGVMDADTPSFLRASKDAVSVELFDSLGVSAAFVGNWHSRRQWGHIFQVGALVPTGWDNPGLDGYGTLALWEDGVPSFEEIPGPRFIKADNPTNDIARGEAAGHSMYVRMTGDTRLPSLSASVVASCWEPDNSDEELVAATGAAFAAKTAETLDESLSGYVAEMSLPDGVDRDNVLNRCREYLK